MTTPRDIGASSDNQTGQVSESDAFARWLELISGTPELAEQARSAVDDSETMPEFFSLMEALASIRLAVQADIKDDETFEEMMLAMCGTRQLPAPDLPDEPPQGPARISVLLDTLLEHAPRFGKRMIVLDDEDDSWNVVLVDEQQGDEFLRLCEQLGVGIMEQDQWQ
ncbi:hypothetical protein GJV26_00350 [Massilia dura]|uniref:DUF6630 domain-containing protein n=1 Tax=Pseudoduganella dura TaxID=321982 RepID=A0A6I3XDX5_9BURK|nr:hypothetical protein [Pseudoduganella dura]MUI10948.1 hypothetical protein [Pseudoduganella dura]GGY02931.1 hypothetical protein GCM10007386_37350 [Pseudoduganella dura]